MKGFKLRLCAEGIAVTAVGLIFTALSLSIRNNPVALYGMLNLFIQAKFIPLILSILITVQGLRLTVALHRGSETTAHEGGFTPRAITMLLITAAYLLLASLAGFAVPTVLYIGVALFMANRGENPLHLLALTALYSVLSLLLIPAALNLQLF